MTERNINDGTKKTLWDTLQKEFTVRLWMLIALFLGGVFFALYLLK